MWGANIDGVDLRVGRQLIVGKRANAVLGGECLGPLPRTRTDGNHLGPFRDTKVGGECPGYHAGPKDSPSHHWFHAPAGSSAIIMTTFTPKDSAAFCVDSLRKTKD
jgi:hypothetical protein